MSTLMMARKVNSETCQIIEDGVVEGMGLDKYAGLRSKYLGSKPADRRKNFASNPA